VGGFLGVCGGGGWVGLGLWGGWGGGGGWVWVGVCWVGGFLDDAEAISHAKVVVENNKRGERTFHGR